LFHLDTLAVASAACRPTLCRRRCAADAVPPTLCLLPSPLTGAAVWDPVAERLAADGWQVVNVPLPATAPAHAADVLAAFVAAMPEDQDAVLIPHSNAGLYVPAISTRRPVVGYIFTDAVLPPPHGQAPMIPADLYEVIAAKADADGLLPPWTQWWDEDISRLFPDAQTRARIERNQPRLLLSYFDGSLTVPDGWDVHPGAYLAFGDTYAAERADAASRGWPTRTLTGEHLHTLVNPAQVAAALTKLLSAL
jgi:hypothetical protein